MLPLLFVMAAAPLQANDDIYWQQQIAQRLQALDNTEDSDWSYNVERLYEGDRFLMHYNGAEEPAMRWQLLSVNGLEADKSQHQYFEAFVKDWLKQKEAGESDSLLEMVDLDSLQLISRQGNHVQYQFVPTVRDLENEKSQLQGRLLFDVGSLQLLSLRIENTAVLKPALAVKINHFFLALDFEPHFNCEVVNRSHLKIFGKVAYIKTVNFESEEYYSNFKALAPRCQQAG
jgi:succinate dehydrogenase flavin-adding protein (antitoxin of CptAB toxin-antitoxin module)